MSDPISLSTLTPAMGLPLLMVGQAQKEFFVNQALCLLDALYPRAVTASQDAPPATAPDGTCYRVTEPATGAWVGHEGNIAVMLAGVWHFIEPAEGLVLFDRTAARMIVFRSQWNSAPQVAQPSGGAVSDTEARAAIAALIAALQTAGVLGPTPS